MKKARTHAEMDGEIAILKMEMAIAKSDGDLKRASKIAKLWCRIALEQGERIDKVHTIARANKVDFVKVVKKVLKDQG